jgi:SAM-dependent methyltransferase
MDNPVVYHTFQNIVSPRKSRDLIQKTILGNAPIQDVIDFGCGVGNFSLLFQNANYLGIEPLKACVDSANKKYAKTNIQFLCGDENALLNLPNDSVDLIIAIGVLHHMIDEKVSCFASEAIRVLKPGARLFTLDPVYFENQNLIAKKVISMDRGENVRFEDHYLELLLRTKYTSFSSEIYKTLLRIPYHHVLIQLTK